MYYRLICFAMAALGLIGAWLVNQWFADAALAIGLLVIGAIELGFSLFTRRLAPVIWLNRLLGLAAVLALGLLLLAANIGGSFHLSPSNQQLTIWLAATSVVGVGSWIYRII